MDNQNDVWINRQEYERLRAIEVQSAQAKIAMGGEPVVAPVEMVSPDKPSDKIAATISIVLMVIFAISSLLYPLLVIGFLILGVFNIVMFGMRRSPAASRITVGIALSAVLIFAAPYIMFIIWIMTFDLRCQLGIDSCDTA